MIKKLSRFTTVPITYIFNNINNLYKILKLSINNRKKTYISILNILVVFRLDFFFFKKVIRRRVMLPDVHPQIALLFGLVRAQRALELGLLVAAFILFVPPHRRLPFVPFAAVAARELRIRAVSRTDQVVREFFYRIFDVFRFFLGLQKFLERGRDKYVIEFQVI